VILLLAGLGVRAIVKVHAAGQEGRERFGLGVLGILGLLLAPGTATYHFVLLWLPVALLAGHLWKEKAPRSAYALVGLYVILGFIPYSFTKQFASSGIFTLLAYPRLLISLAMFAVTLYFAWNKAPRAHV